MTPGQTASSTELIAPLEPTPLEIPVLTTESGRFILRPFTLDDAPNVYRYLSDPRIAATTTVEHPYPEGAAERWIARHQESAQAGDSIAWAIVRTEDSHLLGVISLYLTPAHRRGELGYWLGVPHWGEGIMSEAARRVVAYGFASLGLHRIEAQCLPTNTGSARVMEKCGMRFEGVLRGHTLTKGEFVDLASYAILEDDPIPRQI